MKTRLLKKLRCKVCKMMEVSTTGYCYIGEHMTRIHDVKPEIFEQNLRKIFHAQLRDELNLIRKRQYIKQIKKHGVI